MAVTVIIAIGAGCLGGDPGDHSDSGAVDSGPAPWHLSSSVIETGGSCGTCHYGLNTFWRTNWEETSGFWNLTISPLYREVQLIAVTSGDVVEINDWSSHPWSLGETRAFEFRVANATHVMFKAYGSDAENLILDATANRRDVVETNLTLTNPQGIRYEADGPEKDLRIVAAPAVDGLWLAEVTYLDGPPTGMLHVYHELSTGEMVARIDKQATFRVSPDADGRPLPTKVRVHPHHDHALFQQREWDFHDSMPYEVEIRPELGHAAVPKQWAPSEIQDLWPSDQYMFTNISGTFYNVYMDQRGHQDLGFGHSYPHYQSVPSGIPVLPGTKMIRFDLTWMPATEEPSLSVKFSPANWLYYIELEPYSREAGRALFEMPIRELWWEPPDQHLSWWDPHVVRTHYDTAPFIKEDGALHAQMLNYTLKAYAMR